MTLTDETHIVLGDRAPRLHLTPAGWCVVAALFSLFVLWPLLIWAVVLIVRLIR